PHVPSTEIAMQVQQVEFTFPSEKFLDEVKQPQFFERYRGRVIEITGKVGRVAKDDQGPFVTLQAGGGGTGLRCYTSSKETRGRGSGEGCRSESVGKFRPTTGPR